MYFYIYAHHFTIHFIRLTCHIAITCTICIHNPLKSTTKDAEKFPIHGIQYYNRNLTYVLNMTCGYEKKCLGKGLV